MKCKMCGGTGISNTCVNGTFKPCTFCDGTGEIFQCPKCGEITHMNNIGSLFDHDYAWYKIECPQCGYCSDGGTDPQKAIDMFVKGVGNIPKPLTNEEWFVNLPTEEKARFFSHEMRCEFCPNQEQCDSLGANCKVLWELWLKQPHHESVSKCNE